MTVFSPSVSMPLILSLSSCLFNVSRFKLGESLQFIRFYVDNKRGPQGSKSDK